MTNVTTIALSFVLAALAGCNMNEEADNASALPNILYENVVVEVGATDAQPPWYMWEARPDNLKAALAAPRDDPGNNDEFAREGSEDICQVLKTVKLSCDLNTRRTLSMFLTVNGKGLFPDKQGPEGAIFLEDLGGYPNDIFWGQPVQDKILANAVRKNASLFRDGNLTADDVKKKWR